MGVGDNPFGVAVHPDGTRAYTANFFPFGASGGNSVSVIDTATDTLTNTVVLAPATEFIGSFGLSVHSDGTRVYVANQFDDSFSVIDTATETLAATLPITGNNPFPKPTAFGKFIGPVDKDGDGIVDLVDGFVDGSGVFNDQSLVASSSFTNQDLCGTSFGSIVDPSDLVITVESPAGLVVKAGGGGAGTATISACGQNLFLTDGQVAEITCGSLTVKAIVGTIVIPLSPDIVVAVPTGATVTVKEIGEGQFKIKNPGTPRVFVEFQGQPIVLGPGDEVFLPAVADHFLCYKVKLSKGTPKFTRISGISLVDRFEEKDFDILKPRSLCTPANKNNEGVIDEEIHLTGYKIKKSRGVSRSLRQSRVALRNQFGTTFVDTTKPDLLLVPSAKSLQGPIDQPDPASHGVDHFKCSKVKLSRGVRFPMGIQVNVADQFGNKRYGLKKPSRLCTPVDKNGEGINNPDAHLLCYKVKPARGEPKHSKVLGLHVNNQFGPERLDTIKEQELCVPSLRVE